MKKAYLLALFTCLGTSLCGIARGDAPFRVGDSFEVRIGGVPATEAGLIAGPYTVDGEGNLNLAYIGKVQAAGLTPSQFQSRVEHAYSEGGIFTHPAVTVNVAAASRLITVGGEVNSRGRVPYTADMTVMSAIGAAGDFTIFANQAKVRLIRGDTVKEINCKKIRSNPSLDIKVLPGDNIQVPQTMF